MKYLITPCIVTLSILHLMLCQSWFNLFHGITVVVAVLLTWFLLRPVARRILHGRDISGERPRRARCW